VRAAAGLRGGGESPVPTGPPGTLDASFGAAGTVVTTGAAALSANALALQDGKVIVVGSSGVDAGRTFYVARYNGDGSLDARFGTGGSVTTVFNAAAGSEARAVALQADGKIVAVGGSAGACALARYNADGSLDSSFGTFGTVASPSAHGSVECTDVAIQPDGKLVTAVSHDPNTFPAGSVMRFLPDGSRDPSFGAAGEVSMDCCAAARIVLRPDGTLVVAGTRLYAGLTAQFVGLRSQLVVAQFDSAGAPDAGFGDGGYAPLVRIGDDSCTAGGAALDQEGRVVAMSGPTCTPLVMVRVIADGSLDLSFGTAGYAANPLEGAFAEGYALALQANGKPVVAGSAYLPPADGVGTWSAALIRYSADGAPDSGFGNAGIAMLPITGSTAANALDVMPDGRIVIAGNVTTASSQPAIFVARYFGDAP
jgi:uncharacterized delta-60 repeat protein